LPSLLDATMLNERVAAAMARSIRSRIDICELDLTGWVVATEAATGPYATTAAAAVAAGAEVWAVAADSPYGTVGDAERDVATLLQALGEVPTTLSVITDKDELPYERIRLVTNSGFLRPIDAAMIKRLPKSAVIALMYEVWEARDGDIDYAAASERGVRIIGVDEHHPACGAFELVGDLVFAAALRRRWPIRWMRYGVLSDNPFGEVILDALRSLGARAERIHPDDPVECDVVVVATTPAASAQGGDPLLQPAAAADLVAESGAFGCIQLWGDLDVGRLRSAGVMVEPEEEPRAGHQGIGMGDAGFEAVVRLQVGGMSAAFHASEPDSPIRSLGVELSWSRA